MSKSLKLIGVLSLREQKWPFLPDSAYWEELVRFADCTGVDGDKPVFRGRIRDLAWNASWMSDLPCSQQLTVRALPPCALPAAFLEPGGASMIPPVTKQRGEGKPEPGVNPKNETAS